MRNVGFQRPMVFAAFLPGSALAECHNSSQGRRQTSSSIVCLTRPDILERTRVDIDDEDEEEEEVLELLLLGWVLGW